MTKQACARRALLVLGLLALDERVCLFQSDKGDWTQGFVSLYRESGPPAVLRPFIGRVSMRSLVSFRRLEA